MQAIVQTRYGTVPEEVLRLERIARPVPAAGEVLVRVQAAGVDRGTWHLMAGQPYLMRLGFGFRRPRNRVPGMDVAGTVVATGPGVTRFAVGDEVFGIARGSFAEYAVARAAKLARKPATLTFVQAAAVAVSGLTALQGLRDAGRIQPGQKVLVIGASGGVGSYAVQLAKVFGAEVTGVCGTAKTDLVRALGADHVIDYTKADFAAGRLRRRAPPLRPDPRHRREHPAVPAAPDAGPPRHARHRRRRRRQVDRNRTAAPRPGALAADPPAADHGRLHAPLARPRHAAPAHRIGPGHPGRRTDLPAHRGPPGHPPPARRPGPGQARHHHLRPTA